MKKFLVMNKTEVEKVKATSRARKGPWIEWEGEMWKKTVVKRMYKLLPQTDRMSEAVAVINEHEGLDKTKLEAKTIMDRFETSPQEAEMVEPIPSCEFCEMVEGKHQDGCPDNVEGMP
jgi:recombination protein RecT